MNSDPVAWWEEILRSRYWDELLALAGSDTIRLYVKFSDLERAVQSVEGDRLASLAKGRDLSAGREGLRYMIGMLGIKVGGAMKKGIGCTVGIKAYVLVCSI